MKKHFILIAAIAMLNTGNAPAQQNKTSWQCADDEIENLNRARIKNYDALLEKANWKLKNFIDANFTGNNKNSGGQNLNAATYTIPVVFHVVHPAGQAYGSGANISYAQIVSQLNALNAAYSKNYPAYNGQSHASYAQNTDVQFCLAQIAMPATANWYVGPTGTEYGVMRYADNTGATNHPITTTGAQQLLAITHPNATYFPFANYLNIWVVNSISGSSGGTVMGYAPRPILSSYPLDGLVLRSDICGDNSTGSSFNLGFGLEEGKVAAHEVGHYFNLYHIFQGGCAGMNAAGAAVDACDLNGDFICDIEPSTTTNVPCGNVYNTCVANYTTGTTANDMTESYMSYSDDNCMNTFTQNQCQRMWATLTTMRSNLWSQSNLIATGIQGGNGCLPSVLTSTIGFTQQAYCINAPITVSNPTNGNTATSWNWQFPGATPASSTNSSATIQYATAGNKTIYLTVSDGSNTVIDSAVISITTCVLDSTKMDRANWFFGAFASMGFNTGTALPNNLAVVNQTINGFESSVSMSDSSGNLLFYSDGINVWNSSHQQINLAPIFNHTTSTVPGIIGVPYPGHPGQYYIVSAPPSYINDSCARYVLVDLNNNTVSNCQRFTHPSLPTKMSECATIIPHCNGFDYWVIMRGYPTQSNGRFYSILLTQAGLSPGLQPVVSANFTAEYSGQLKGNHAGDKVIQALFSQGGFAVYDFDNVTGAVTNQQIATGSFGGISTGVIFSPNDNYIYLDEEYGGADLISQYDANNLSTPRKVLGTSLEALQFEIGPDNNIYIAQTDWNTLYLDMITNADSWANSTVVTNAVNFTQIGGGMHTFAGLPNFIDAPKPAELTPDFAVNIINCTTVNFTADNCWQAYNATWNFGDGTTGTGLNVNHTYSVSGNYTVTLTLTYSTYSFPAVIKVVFVAGTPVASITGPDTVCVGTPFPVNYSVPFISGAIYNWTSNIGNIVGAANTNSVSVSYLNIGTDTLHVTSSNVSCSTNATKVVVVVAAPSASLALSPNSCCITNTVTLTGGSPAGGVYLVNGVATNPVNASSLGVGTHTITYQYANATGCFAQATDTLQVLACTGINNPDNNTLISVMPNPFNNKLTVTLAGEFIDCITVFDIAGRKVTEINGNKTRSVQLNTSEWEEGVYVIRLVSNQKTTAAKLVTLQRD